MARAVFNGQVVAESDKTEVVEGNHYFPPDSIRRKYFKDNPLTTNCPWKGEARYYDVVVDGKTAEHAAWYYPETKPQAKSFEGYVAFWRGVTVEA